MRYLMIGLIVLLTGCVSVPEGIDPVKNFQSERYLGTWYEIARLDHSFERGMQQVTADYSLREDGGIKVINRGFKETEQQWAEAEGKAYFVEDKQTGYLKVSFFGPFYGAYIVFDLGDDYEHALVTSHNRSYLWLLSRTPTLQHDHQQRLLQRITELGFATDQLIFVDQSMHRN
ncbi:lipocalin [Pseudomonas sp. C27(2019)]|uniref:lipocalin family protein n=1 Tax=Pseudomonas sp. C27(2019) TaxID=2604941 RepID=UPI0012441D1E|nr:lipocalin family protein [Pseudomonas sp. C27(2019)]QEY59924.1 lipocalin [Pseudomonas sp. C27(2019)]